MIADEKQVVNKDDEHDVEDEVDESEDKRKQ